jgi:hypothetical protein
MENNRPQWWDRFWAKVAVAENGCWEWQASITKHGYGRFSAVGSRPELAHRLAYQALVGQIPSGLVIDHLCRNRRCVNPSHLEVVSADVNTLRGGCPAAVNAKKTHCPNGHPLVGDHLSVDALGKRRCRTCTNQKALDRYYRIKESRND